MNNNKDTCQVFISHCHASNNVDFLDLLCSKFREANIQFWMDTISIKGGEEWRAAIDSGIRNSDVILVIFDQAACDSDYVKYEWAFALGCGKTIIPILMEDCKLHEQITVLQYIDFRNRSRPWDKLIERIKAVQLKHKEPKKVTDLDVSELLTEFEKILNDKKDKINSTKQNGMPLEFSLPMNRYDSIKKQLKSIPDCRKRILWIQYISFSYAAREFFESMGFILDVALSEDEALILLRKREYCAIISAFRGNSEEYNEGYLLVERIRKFDIKTPCFIYFLPSDPPYQIQKSRLPKLKSEAQRKGAQGFTDSILELMIFVASYVHIR